MPNPLLNALVRPLLLIALTSCTITVNAQEEIAKAEFVVEVDPYYSNVGYNIPLTAKPIPTITSDSEVVIYRELIKDSLIPRFMTLEASAYPMPILGTYLKTHQRGLYDSGEIGGSGINLIESLTAGFQEPWALSAFFGNVAKLRRPGTDGGGDNYGYTGYLLNIGAKHIKNNTMIDDDWYEVEWKIKGKLDYPGRKLSWSLRGGTKVHSNPDVNDIYYLAASRSHTEVNLPFLGWLENASVETRLHFLQRDGKPVRAELIAGKKFPMPKFSIVPTLSAGFIWNSPDEYSGLLRDATGNRLTFILRPSFEF
ncbi:MAG: hypothetical protein WC053_08450 [Sideroxydans sp.]